MGQKHLRQIIREQLLLEKRIDSLVRAISVQYGFEIQKTTHVDDRITRSDIYNYNETPIDNSEISRLIGDALKMICESIATHDLFSGDTFVVISIKRNLSLAIQAHHEGGVGWRLVALTAFREDKRNHLYIYRGELVFNMDSNSAYFF